MKSKKTLLVFVASYLFLNTFAQEVTPIKIREVGIGLYNFQNFSLQYRWGNEKRLFRLTGNLGINSTDGSSDRYGWREEDTLFNSSNFYEDVKTPINLNVGLGFSILKFKPINDKFGLMYGPLIGLSYTYLQSEKISSSSQTGTYYSGSSVQKSQTIQPYLGIVFGAAYKINASFFIYAEIGPNFYYAFNQSYSTSSTHANLYHSEDETSSKNNSVGISSLSNSGAMLTFVYRYNN